MAERMCESSEGREGDIRREEEKDQVKNIFDSYVFLRLQRRSECVVKFGERNYSQRDGRPVLVLTNRLSGCLEIKRIFFKHFEYLPPANDDICIELCACACWAE